MTPVIVETGPDFEPVRGRDDFQKLVAELESGPRRPRGGTD
jgi:hypothetical protein